MSAQIKISVYALLSRHPAGDQFCDLLSELTPPVGAYDDGDVITTVYDMMVDGHLAFAMVDDALVLTLPSNARRLEGANITGDGK